MTDEPAPSEEAIQQRQQVICAIADELNKHVCFHGRWVSQLVWATRIYEILKRRGAIQ